jgi:hypothetical protein
LAADGQWQYSTPISDIAGVSNQVGRFNHSALPARLARKSHSCGLLLSLTSHIGHACTHLITLGLTVVVITSNIAWLASVCLQGAAALGPAAGSDGPHAAAMGC